MPLAERPRPTVFAACGMVALAAAGLWIASALAELLFPESELSEALLTGILYYLPFVLLPIVAYCTRMPGLSDGLRLNPMPVMPTLSVMFLAVMCVYAASLVDSLWVTLISALGLHEPSTAVRAASAGGLTWQIIGTAAVPAVCEELLFRGVAFSAFERRGTRFGLWMSSILFALMHGNLFGLPAYLLVGAVSAYVVYALDSLYAGMLFHTVYNAAIVVILYLAAGMSEADAAAAVASTSAASILLDAAFVGMMILFTLRVLSLRRRAAGIQPVPRSREPFDTKTRIMFAAMALLLIVNCAVIQILTEAGL